MAVYINGVRKRTLADYGEAYIYDNSVATVIETVDIPIALRQISGGLVNNFVFDAGSTGPIASYELGTGGAGYTKVNDVAHSLSNGDIITIRGSTVAAYNGVHTVSSVSTDYFDIDATFSSDGGVSDWDQGASLMADGISAGKYCARWLMNTAPAAASTLIWVMYLNAVAQTKSVSSRKYAINDLACCSSACILDITDGDLIWLAVQSDDTHNITNKYGQFSVALL